MKKRNFIRLISLLSAAIAVAAGFGIKYYTDNRRYRLELENGYSRTLSELNAGINNISLILQKAEYVNSAALISETAAQLISEAQTAKTALSQLPLGENELTVLNKFLSQVGNYAVSVSKSVISGNDITEEQRQNISVLYETSKKIAEAVSNAEINYDNIDYWVKELDRKLADAVPEDSLASSLNDLEEDLSDYPTLVYDGPYSDHILESESELLANAPEITREEALSRAGEAAGENAGELKFQMSEEGKVPSYRFGNENVSVSVTRFGGYIKYMRKLRIPENGHIEYANAVSRAKKYLGAMGMTDFTETYYYTDEGVCVVNFAYLDGETICYPDLIKVGVAMDNGEIMLLECGGYLANHKDRAFETPRFPSEQAALSLSPALTLKQTSLALIPTDYGKELRCYEMLCAGKNGEEILVYINTQTLDEERILILLKNDGGTLAK